MPGRVCAQLMVTISDNEVGDLPATNRITYLFFIKNLGWRVRLMYDYQKLLEDFSGHY